MTPESLCNAAAAQIEQHHLARSQERLSKGETRHERRLLRCIGDLVRWVAPKHPEVQDCASLQSWARSDPSAAGTSAALFLAEYLDKGMGQASISQNVGNYMRAWKQCGIVLPAPVMEQIRALSQEHWKPSLVRRERWLRLEKVQQFETLHEAWPAMVRYLGAADADGFREVLRKVARRDAGPAIAASSQTEMLVISNKPSAALRMIMLRTRAFASMLRATGMRGGAGVMICRDDFTVVPDGEGVLLTRMERKGNVARVERPVYVRVVPSKDPAMDTLLHLAEFLDQARDAKKYFFAQGFEPRGLDDRSMTSFRTMVQRRYIAVLHAAAVAVGIPDGLGVKRLHAFRSLCTNTLDALGATAPEREAHVGWANGTQSRYYTARKHCALHARTPYLLAGRTDRRDKPHPLWTLVREHPPAQSSIGALLRTALDTARRSGALTGGEAGLDAVLQSRVAEMERQRDQANPEDLRNRLREAELEIAKLRNNNKSEQQNLPPPTPAPHGDLLGILGHLKAHGKEADFPKMCFEHWDSIKSILDSHGGFLLPQSSASGKLLRAVLLLATLHGRRDAPVERDFPTQSWLSWVRKHRCSHPAIKGVSTSSWGSFLASRATPG